MTPAEQHAYDAGRFTELVKSASSEDWARPSPIRQWSALDVVRHLLDWLPGFVERAGVDLAPVDVDGDPVAAWNRRTADVQGLLETKGDLPYHSPMFGERPLGESINQFYVNDVWMHSWDLARSLGQQFDLGEERCAAALVAMTPMDDLLRQGGQFGPKVDVPAEASAQSRFLGFIGRDPAWTP